MMDWDRFNFKYRLDFNNLLPDLIQIEAYKESAVSLVLPPDWRDQLDRLNRVRAVHGTTALEGNPLSQAEVSRQIDIVEDPKQATKLKATREQQQIRNAGRAQNWIRKRFVPNRPPLGVDDVLYLHRVVTEFSDETHNLPGKLRTFPVVVGSVELGGVHRGAPHKALPRLMDDYIALINSRQLREAHPVIRALLAHFFLVTLHPFGDGNGRVSRLVEAGILFQGGYNVFGFYGLSNYFYRNEVAYKTILQGCRSAQPFDVTPFIQFGLRGFAAELKGINNFIKSKLNRVVYRAMLVRAFNTKTGERRRALNNREYSLLDYLITQTEPIDPFSDNPSRQITLSELQNDNYVLLAYKHVTQRTFMRELTRLAALGFISFVRPEGKGGPILELDFGAIGRY